MSAGTICNGTLTGKAAIVGGGVIGGGWAARFLLMGWDVTVFDPAPDAKSKIQNVLAGARRSLPKLYDATLPAEGQLTFAGAIADACRDASWIQESIPERLDLKLATLREIQNTCAPNAIVASSTSGFRPSELQAASSNPGQIIVAHPFNPVYLLPLVELVGSDKSVARATQVLDDLGMKPLHVRREIDAHIADRLLEAVWREALWLVNDGVATTSEIDDAIRYGFGLRWAQMGLFETYRIAGGEAGMSHFLQQFGPALKWPWTKLMDVPELTDELVGTIAEQSDTQSGHHSIRELEQIRDDNLVAILRALRSQNSAAGALINAHDEDLANRQPAQAPAASSTWNYQSRTASGGQTMSSATKLPWTPDFETYGTDHAIAAASIEGDAVMVDWNDGRRSAYHAVLLRENSPDAETIHPLSREMLIDPLDIPADIVAENAEVTETGALRITWSHGNQASEYHPGWLNANAHFTGESEQRPHTEANQIRWASLDLAEPPTSNGPAALADDHIFLSWLEKLRDYGIARLEHLPPSEETLESVAKRIGTVRETNFGRTFDVVVKDDPNSNAYTSAALVQHMDLATRETPPGLQFLFCRTNSTSGGEGIYVDGYRVAEDMRAEDPDNFHTLSTTVWEFKNRARDCDYRSYGPIFDLDRSGHVNSVRYTPWLRAPLRASLDCQRNAYRAIRAFMERNRWRKYQIKITYRPGDLLVFDNRRVMHGRSGYDAAGGERHLHGCYMDRDDLHSAIRIQRRKSADSTANV